MKQTQKRKTLTYQSKNNQYLQHKRKNNSTATFLKEETSRLVVFDVIEHLMTLVFAKEKMRARYVTDTLKKLSAFQALDSLYFNLDFEEEKQILCKQDAQPPHQQNKSLEVVKTHLKKSSRKFADLQDISQNQSVMSITEVDKKDRETIIQKLKKQYSMILQSKYLSESTPIGQSRTFFKQNDTPQIATMRKNYRKAVVIKQPQKHKESFIEQQIRKKHKLNTIFKKSKNFVETIDPTISNSMYMSQIQPQGTSQRNSFFALQQPQVIVKLSNMKDITNQTKIKKELASTKNIPNSPDKQNNTRFSNIIAEKEIEFLKQKVERSFHSNDRMKFREISDTEQKARLNNSISVRLLPRISKGR